ncbi:MULTISPECIES: restriction endonuclease subunit S [Pseudoalteromonas]|uniref:restriction endonuclease subunit S n=1 Tax=Pseudoalteromonas TaxID=53246 RepID=UPI0006BAAB24|nr:MULTISPECIES: restriction endonuclease subunit S [Pseudoalteromonas]
MSWPLVKLGELVKVKGGKRLPKGSGYSESKTAYPYIRVTDFKNNSVRNSGLVYIEKEIQKKIARYTISCDDVYISIAGTIGIVGIIPEQLDGANLTENAAKLVINNKGQLDKNYLVRFLSTAGQAQIHERKKTTSQPKLALFRIEEVEIPLPPLDEQKRIAAILDKADAIRRKRQQAIQLADDFLRSVFLDMFGDPVTNPKGWEVKKFSDLGNWASGGTPSRSVSGYFEGEINWFSARELNHRYLNESVEKITDEALSKSAAKIFPAGSMLVGMYDTAAFKISILNVASASNQACANIIPNEKIDIEWFFSFIEFSKETYLRQRRGVRQQNLNLGMIKDFDLPLPPKTEQEKFVKLAHKTMQMKERNYSSLSNSLDNFNSLSQKAFAGEL